MYQVGDKVKIIPLTVAETWNSREHDGVHFASSMLDYCGKVATITAIRIWHNDFTTYGLDLDNGAWNWIPAMFEQVSVEPTVSFF